MQVATSDAETEPEVIDISSDSDNDEDNDDDDASVVETDAELFNHYLNLPLDDFNAFLDLPYSPSENLNGAPEGPAEDPRPVITASPAPPVRRPDPEECYKLFLGKVLEVFPDHCRDKLKKLYDAQIAAEQGSKSRLSVEEFAVEVILEIVQSKTYPKETDRRKNLKRKRTESDNEDEVARYMAPERQKAAPIEIQEAWVSSHNTPHLCVTRFLSHSLSISQHTTPT